MSPAATREPQDELENKTVSKLLWRLLPFLFLLYIVAFLDRINVGFAALGMQKQLGLNDKIFGTAFGFFFLGYFFLQIPSNLVLARVGARRWIAVIMVAWGVISCCMALVSTPREFYLLRFLLGVAEAGFFPGMILYLRNWFPRGARARAVAWFMTANPLAGVIGGPISGALLGLHWLGIAGWQWLFVLEGLPAGMMATFSMLGPFWAAATSLMSGTAAAAGIALINSVGNLGGFFGPYIIGVKRSSGGGFRGGMLIIAAFLALAGVLASLVQPSRERSAANRSNPLQ